MRSLPISFNAAMVRALLDGSKTQTRCVAKLPNENSIPQTRSGDVIACPYGVIGDELWVREIFTMESNLMDELPDYNPPFTDRRPIKYHVDEYGDKNKILWVQPKYKATDKTQEFDYENKQGFTTCKWKPAIFMPKWASRITLKITDIHIEKLNDISKRDAKAEGVLEYKTVFMKDISAYTNLWESINGVGSWLKNPYVWVMNFELANYVWPGT